MKQSLVKRVMSIIIAMSTFAWVATAADNTLGTWKYNAAKSKPAEGQPPYNSLIVTREAVHSGVRQTARVERGDGSKAEGVVTTKYDGKPGAVNGNLPWDTVAAKQIDTNTVSEELAKRGGKFRATRRVSVSADGKTMTATTTGVDQDGKTFTSVAVFDKQ